GQALCRLHVAQVSRVYKVEGACLRRHNVGRAKLAQTQGPESTGVPDRDQPVTGEEKHRIGPLYMVEGVHYRSHEVGCAGARHLVQDNLSVRAGRKDRAVQLQLLPGPAGVRQVAVVAKRDLSAVTVHKEWLS